MRALRPLPLLAVLALCWPGSAFPAPVDVPPFRESPHGQLASGGHPPCPAEGSQPRLPSGPLRDAPFLLARGREHPEAAVRMAYYREVETLAGEVLAHSPDDLDARWWRVAAIGLRVDEESPREKVRMASTIHEEVRWILERDPSHAGAHHAMGRLHAGIMRLNPVVRFFARRLVGDDTLRSARWEDAEAHLRAAVAIEPCFLRHRYELAKVLSEQGLRQEAAEEVRALLALPDRDPMDPVVRTRVEGMRW